MPACEVCGNEYDKPIEITMAGRRGVFDCFECAIHLLAPACAHCGCRIIGHGVEVDGIMYCCAHCARVAGASDPAHGPRRHHNPTRQPSVMTPLASTQHLQLS